ncbi:MAG: hypothetical protein QS748_14335 [Candidatus Endonucleobacter bathymodioli]|uniref:Uncharacterized protein n=1 Tax=Candidatus Endonucleibacter bathymodioli TaxID=539814 RepID=A0AA90SUJ1_9GAMM|nr:hypothetical protein [Candidatus Endonucleobacter bathymodioli]
MSSAFIPSHLTEWKNVTLPFTSTGNLPFYRVLRCPDNEIVRNYLSSVVCKKHEEYHCLSQSDIYVETVETCLEISLFVPSGNRPSLGHVTYPLPLNNIGCREPFLTVHPRHSNEFSSCEEQEAQCVSEGQILRSDPFPYDGKTYRQMCAVTMTIHQLTPMI